MAKQKISIFWFRRDLRLEDNHGLHQALKANVPVLPIFIFDTEILEGLDPEDARVTFIYDLLKGMHQKLTERKIGLRCIKGTPLEVYQKLVNDYEVQAVYTNEDYEPYALKRDQKVAQFLKSREIPFFVHKDQVIFAKGEILKNDGKPYTVYTPYKNKWLEHFSGNNLQDFPIDQWEGYLKQEFPFPSLEELGFKPSSISVPDFDLGVMSHYANNRDYPAKEETSRLGPHLRFGTLSIRKLVGQAKSHSVFLSELIWREFFMQILYHFPQVVDQNFKPQYNGIAWRNKEEEFSQWKKGQTGYPIVDAGMRELNTTGFMHNRVRMVVASFLCKHLLIDWRWGETYFAEKLLDYELAANNGNWQWAAGTGCDAAPYFRVFNPTEQVKKFDPDLKYIKKWVPELDSLEYPTPMVEHKFARNRALETYKQGINNN